MPDLILIGAVIPIEPGGARAGALAVAEGRVLAVGGRDAVLAGRSRATRVVDLGAGAVLPGFGDAHVHLALTGLGLLGARAAGCRSLADLADALADHARRADPALPLWAHGVSPGALAEGRPPTRAELDRVAPERPLLLVDRGHHACYANAAMLAALAARDPELAGADRDGALIGAANARAKAAFAGLVPAEVRRAAIRAARAHAARVGLTRLHALDGGWSGPDDPPLILEEAARPGPRIALYEQVMDVTQVRGRGLPRIGGDIWLDGGLYQRTAAFSAPYADDPAARGLLYHADAALFPFVEEAHRSGLQVAVHAIGDRAIEQALRAYAAAQAAHPRSDPRHRIEHFTYATPAQHARAAELGVVLSMQPNIPFTHEADTRMTVGYLGPERAALKSHVRRALDAGALVAGGSDADVRPLDPLWAIDFLVSDERPGRRVSLDEALRIFTLNVAAASFDEAEAGSLAPGKRADLVILDRDPAAVEPARIKEIGVRATLVGGEVVWGSLDGVGARPVRGTGAARS
jgi:predicted amidohydrolase YtcJ